MKKICFFSLFLAVFIYCFLLNLPGVHTAEAAENSPPSAGDDTWETMPPGARPAYMGIHGGTMPISLLVSGDGSALVTFVGRTGNDFLEVLKKTYQPLPSFGNSTTPRSWVPSHAGLFAGNATASMPVFYLSGDALAKTGLLERLQPFGLSTEPLAIEGEIAKPRLSPPVKKYRILGLPEAFQQKRSRK